MIYAGKGEKTHVTTIAGFVGIELKEMHVSRALNEISIKGGRRERRQTGKACCLMQAICCPPRVSPFAPSYATVELASLRAQQAFGRHPALSDIRIRMTPLSNAQVGLPPSRWALKATQFIFSRRSTDGQCSATSAPAILDRVSRQDNLITTSQ